MADTNLHHHSEPIPVESDGISYKGLVWFTAFLTATALVIHVLMWVMFEFMERRNEADQPARSAMADPSLQRPPGPNLLAMMNPQAPPTVLGPDEPTNLQLFRQQEDAALQTYGWIDQNAGTIRIPIARAKQLLLERGLAVRGPSAAPAAEVKK
jgi:hypothetical protein